MGACRTCGALGCFGFRLPGLYSEQKSKGYAWFCEDHRADGEAMRNAAIKARGV